MIPFSEAFTHIVQGLHEIFAPVKLALSHPSLSVVALVADVHRAARMIGLDSGRTPRELLAYVQGVHAESVCVPGVRYDSDPPG